MIDEQQVQAYYTTGRLQAAIREAVERIGKSTASITIDDLSAVDEFHIGGRQASVDFHGQLGWSPKHHVLDVGCGLGGAARFVAARYGAQVTGIDLSREYVETGNILSAWVRLDASVQLQVGSALQMPFLDSTFDGAYMMHVGMNVADKAGLFAEVARVLRPRAPFGIYDVMKVGDGDIAFPTPWAATAQTSMLASPRQYVDALRAAGFDVATTRDRREFAIAFFDRLRDTMKAEGGPPPLGLHLLMGESANEKIRNMVGQLAAGLIAPVEVIARRR